MSSDSIARAGVIAAVYAAFTLLAIFTLQGLAWGPIQFRVSEAVTVLALFTKSAIPGLTLGCVIANLIAIPFTGVGALGFLDVVFGSIATCVGAIWMYRFRSRPLVALAGPVISNALIVPAYLPILVMGFGFYTIPFTTIDIEGVFIPMYIFGAIALLVGQGVVLYALGYPLQRALARIGIFKEREPGQEASA